MFMSKIVRTITQNMNTCYPKKNMHNIKRKLSQVMVIIYLLLWSSL